MIEEAPPVVVDNAPTDSKTHDVEDIVEESEDTRVLVSSWIKKTSDASVLLPKQTAALNAFWLTLQ
jgi:hypothetical protein